MSSMVARTLLSTAALPFLALLLPAEPALAQVQANPDWDGNRSQLDRTGGSTMGWSVARWEQLVQSNGFTFEDYASFLLEHPDFPKESHPRQANELLEKAERALERTPASPQRAVQYFTAFPPVTNYGRAQYALALSDLGRPEATELARAAWRGGQMDEGVEAALYARFGNAFTLADNDARMDALLWQREHSAAAWQIGRTSPAMRQTFNARLTALNGEDPVSAGFASDYSASSDTGYVFNRVRQLRADRRNSAAVDLLLARPPASAPAFDQEAFVRELLTTAKSGSASEAMRIALSVDDAFGPGEDISDKSYTLRDDYTSLTWLGGTRALWDLRRHAEAAGLFYRYGNAARTPGTRSKGFYWAGYAAAQGGDLQQADTYFRMASEYPAQFYGQLALERLTGSAPTMPADTQAQATNEERREFYARPLTQAIRSVARGGDWRTARQFYVQAAEKAQTPGEMALVVELAQSIGAREMAVVIGDIAMAKGFSGFDRAAHPVHPLPAGADFTVVHAIARQESEFDPNRVSHAGARGLMQVMPATGREQAGKMGLSYNYSAMISDPLYSIQLGDGYFDRMLRYYDGSYPLAVAAYNAGPGNVNKWLRANGDPRRGNIAWVEWIERIPIYETKSYVQHVLENAVTYEALYPERTRYGTRRGISDFLGKPPNG